MILRILNHTFHYEAENLCRVFFPFEKIRTVRDTAESEAREVITELEPDGGAMHIFVSFRTPEQTLSDRQPVADSANNEACELQMMTMLFHVLSQATGYVPPWGILTGVRPSKLMTTLLRTMGDDAAQEYFQKILLVQPDKTSLAYTVAKAESSVIALSRKPSFSLYISIPFCPSRCSYCSFVSHSVEQAKKLIPDYVDNLCRELIRTAEIARQLHLRLESIYWGGGTPTTLDAAQLTRICDVINTHFDLSHLREYTVEAGRPDTVTEEKLHALKRAGVGRISINPQTFNDDVLRAIGRRHTSAQTLDAFRMAREAGFDNINMDLIAGLSSDTYASFCRTLETAASLRPENLTLHTLALKRSSNLVTGGEALESGAPTEKMLRRAAEVFTQNEYRPYYMYRQSRSIGNLENVGWCLPQRECLYNIFMMEECHTVLAVGAGAVTKLKKYGENVIERIFNYKYPYEYNTRFDEILQRKEKITDFYQRCF